MNSMTKIGISMMLLGGAMVLVGIPLMAVALFIVLLLFV